MATVHYHAGHYPPTALDWPPLIPLLGPAVAAGARHEGMLAAVLNPGLIMLSEGREVV